MQLLTTDTQPAHDFNYAWGIFLPKGEDKDDGRGAVRTPENTRPLSASNTDEKLIAQAVNLPLATALPEVAVDWQRGFVKGRQLIDNVLILDTASRILMASGIAPGILLFDFAAAFPSVSWNYLFLALQYAGIPNFVTRIRKFDKNCVHFGRMSGVVQVLFTALSGTKQGCPMSASLFIYAINPFLNKLTSCSVPRTVYGAFADDIGAVVGDLFQAMPKLAEAFAMFARHSGLHLKISKTILIPLWQISEEALRAQIVDLQIGWDR